MLPCLLRLAYAADLARDGNGRAEARAAWGFPQFRGTFQRGVWGV